MSEGDPAEWRAGPWASAELGRVMGRSRTRVPAAWRAALAVALPTVPISSPKAWRACSAWASIPSEVSASAERQPAASRSPSPVRWALARCRQALVTANPTTRLPHRPVGQRRVQQATDPEMEADLLAADPERVGSDLDGTGPDVGGGEPAWWFSPRHPACASREAMRLPRFLSAAVPGPGWTPNKGGAFCPSEERSPLGEAQADGAAGALRRPFSSPFPQLMRHVSSRRETDIPLPNVRTCRPAPPRRPSRGGPAPAGGGLSPIAPDLTIVGEVRDREALPRRLNQLWTAV